MLSRRDKDPEGLLDRKLDVGRVLAGDIRSPADLGLPDHIGPEGIPVTPKMVATAALLPLGKLMKLLGIGVGWFRR